MPIRIHVNFWGEDRIVPLGGIVVVLDEIATLLVKPLKPSQADSK